MHPYIAAVAPYLPLFMPLVGWPLVSALINYLFYKKTPAEWEAWALKKPVLAFLVELCRANGWNITKNAQIIQRYAARRAGQVPEDAWAALPLSVPLKMALRNPATRELLEQFLSQRADYRGTVSPPPPPADAEGG